MFKYDSEDTKTTSSIFIVSFKHIPHLFLELLFLTLTVHLFADNTTEIHEVHSFLTLHCMALFEALQSDAKRT